MMPCVIVEAPCPTVCSATVLEAGNDGQETNESVLPLYNPKWTHVIQ